ncbi:MAG: class I fructose-bisphosphate aldolase [Planctomycetota bacterium]
MSDEIRELLGEEASLLDYECRGISRGQLHLPGPDFADRVLVGTDRPAPVIRNLQQVFNNGRLAGTGYLSILPVDQGIEHSAASAFAPNPIYMDPENIVKLAVEGGCNATASTVGVLGAVSRRYAHKIPFIAKLNHNELMTYPTSYDQTLFGGVEMAFDLGAVGVGATIYYGSEESRRQIKEVSECFELAHSMGLFTVLWCYLRHEAFTTEGTNYERSADLTGQANHLGVTIQADLVKQKQPESNGGFRAIDFGKTDDRVYDELAPDHPIEWTRWQVANCYMGRVPLINSGGKSGEDDLAQVVRAAVINKRAGGSGMITGRKAFQKPMSDGVELLHAVQDVYLSDEVTVA